MKKQHEAEWLDFKLRFSEICSRFGGDLKEDLHVVRFHIPTPLGVLRASIHPRILSRKRVQSHLESVYLRFETYSTGKMHDMLHGGEFNGYSGKWNIHWGARTLGLARRDCLLELERRLDQLMKMQEKPESQCCKL